MQNIKIYKRPKLRNPYMVAAWPGIQNVALGMASYLKDKLQAKVFGEIDPSGFFFPSGVLIENGIVTTPKFSQSNFYYWKNKSSENDLIIFIGDAQPDQNGYELAHKVVDVAQKFQVSKIYASAAYLTTKTRLTEKPKVWGVATRPELVKPLEEYGVALIEQGYIAGMNGLLLGVARERDMDAICLLSEVPRYMSSEGNPRASQAVLEVLTQMLGIEIDMTEIATLAREVQEEMDKEMKQAMGEYIEDFTIDYRDLLEKED